MTELFLYCLYVEHEDRYAGYMVIAPSEAQARIYIWPRCEQEARFPDALTCIRLGPAEVYEEIRFFTCSKSPR